MVPSKRRSLHTDPSSTNYLISQLLKIKKRRTIEDDRIQEAVEIALSLLKDEFEINQAASERFPPEITSSNISTSVSKYEDEMLDVSKRYVCCSCSKLVAIADVYEIHDNDDLVQLLQGLLDHCGHHENSWDFCTSCHSALSCSNVPKFSVKNLINLTMCQHYPPALEELTPIEECQVSQTLPQLLTGSQCWKQLES
jgi:hypothetical protein